MHVICPMTLWKIEPKKKLRAPEGCERSFCLLPYYLDNNGISILRWRAKYEANVAEASYRGWFLIPFYFSQMPCSISINVSKSFKAGKFAGKINHSKNKIILEFLWENIRVNDLLNAFQDKVLFRTQLQRLPVIFLLKWLILESHDHRVATFRLLIFSVSLAVIDVNHSSRKRFVFHLHL